MTAVKLSPPTHYPDSWHAERAMPTKWLRVSRQLVSMRVEEDGADGACIRAQGRTPDEALRNLYTAIGESWLALEAKEGFAVQSGQSPSDIRRTFELTLEEASAVVLVTHGGVEVTERQRELCANVILQFMKWAERPEEAPDGSG